LRCVGVAKILEGALADLGALQYSPPLNPAEDARISVRKDVSVSVRSPSGTKEVLEGFAESPRQTNPACPPALRRTSIASARSGLLDQEGASLIVLIDAPNNLAPSQAKRLTHPQASIEAEEHENVSLRALVIRSLNEPVNILRVLDRSDISTRI
jgi:hypothetical protein